ncbi:MAG TPA: hypothetical protein VIE63_00015 [Ramlibacter sp.]
MLKKTLFALTLLAAFAAQAQNAPLPATPSTNGGAGKKELVARILRAQQASIEGLARQLAERPAAELMGNAMQFIAARVPKEKQEALAKDVQAEARKYADAAVPVVTKHALDLAPSTIGAVLEEKFSEDELRQIAGLLENPAVLKYQRLLPDMQQALGEKLVAETRPEVEPKVNAMEDAVTKKLGIPPAGAAAPAPQGAKPPAKKKTQ